MPSLLPVISLSPNYLAKTKRCCCVSSRVNVGTCLNPLYAPPKIFSESCLPTTTSRRPDRPPDFVDNSRAWGTKGEYNRAMQAHPKLNPIQVLERLQLRLEQRMESLQRVKLDGYHMVISELETELDLLRRAQRYLED